MVCCNTSDHFSRKKHFSACKTNLNFTSGDGLREIGAERIQPRVWSQFKFFGAKKVDVVDDVDVVDCVDNADDLTTLTVRDGYSIILKL